MVAKYSRTTTILFLSFLFILLLGKVALGSGIQVELIEPVDLTTPPGELLTFSYRVLNPTEEKVTLQGQADLPVDFSLLTPAPRFTLAPGQSMINLISFHVPGNTAAGEFLIKYLLKGENDEIKAEKANKLVVSPQMGLDVSPRTVPPRVIAGDSYELLFSIRNVSNTDLRISHSIKDSHGFLLKTNQENFILSPGETEILTVEVKTDQDLRQKIIHWLTLRVEGKTKGKKVIEESARSRVDILPRVSGIDDLYHRLPVSLAADFSYRGDLGVQLKLAARGPIDLEGEKWVDLLIRPPAVGITGEDFSRTSPEYRFSYWNDNWRLDLGDHRFSLSPLTEHRFPGRGVEFTIEQEEHEIGGYFRTDRDWKDSGWGFYVDYYFEDNWGLNLGFLDLAGKLERDRMVTVGSQFSLDGRHNFELEYARNFSAPGAQAYSGDIDGNYEGLRYSLGYLRSDPGFPGRISDRETYNISLGYPLFPEFFLQGAYEHRRINLDFDPEKEALQRDQVELKGRLKLDNTRFDLVYEQQWFRDLHPDPETQGQEFALQGTIRQTFFDFSLRASYKRTWWEDLLIGEDGSYDNFRLWLNYRPTEGQTYRTDYSLKLNEGQIKHWGTLAVRFDLEENVRMDLDYTREYESGSIQQDSSSKDRFTASIGVDFPEEQAEVSLRGRFIRRADKAGEFSVGLEYSQAVSFGLPMSRRPVGRLAGQIFDALDPQKKGRGGVIIKVDGFTAVSDEEGYFEFPDLEPGTYYLQVDRGSLKPEEVIDKKMPLSFSIEAQEKKNIDLPIVAGSSISGQAMVYSPLRNNNNNNFNINNPEGESNGNNSIILNQGVEMGPDYGLSGLLLILRSSDNDETRIEFTDSEGNFRFTSLRPGQYELIVNSNGNLPRHHDIKEEKIVFQLEAGENKDIEIQILPLEREMEFIDEGTVLGFPSD